MQPNLDKQFIHTESETYDRSQSELFQIHLCGPEFLTNYVYSGRGYIIRTQLIDRTSCCSGLLAFAASFM